MAATNGQFWSQVFLKADGTPYRGIQCDHWMAGGTTTNLDVYQEANLAAPHNNPVIGDNAGRVSFYGNGTYRLRIRTSAADGNITLYDWDHVEILHHTATVRAEDRALSLPSASAASIGRLFGTVDGGGDVTGLWMQRTAAAWMQLLTLPTLSQMLEFNKGTDIASTTSVTVPGDGNFFDITGTNTIESFSAFSGYPVIYTRFTGIGLTLVHNGVSLILRTGVNRVTAQNEIVCWLQFASGQWAELWSTRDWMPAAGGTGLATLTPGALFSGNGLLPMQSSGTGAIYQALTSGATGAPIWSYGLRYHGPGSTGSGSTRAHEGTVNVNANQSLGGVHYYTDFTINTGVIVTVNAKFLTIYATNAITINGTLTGAGVVGTGGAGGVQNTVGGAGSNGTDQPGGNGGGGNTAAGGARGNVLYHGFQLNSGSTQVGPTVYPPYSQIMYGLGGATGGGGGGGDLSSGGRGGAGGATIILIAPKITLGNGATLSTAGGNGSTGNTSAGGGGGGGGGNLSIFTHSFIDNGAIITTAGGNGGAPGAPNGAQGVAGSAGAAGIKQINIY
jgi:hypothetical protein